MNDNIVPNILDSPLSNILDSPLSNILDSPLQTFWIHPFKHSGFTPSNILDSPLQTFWIHPFQNPFSHVQQNKTHTTIQPLDDTSHETLWIIPF